MMAEIVKVKSHTLAWVAGCLVVAACNDELPPAEPRLEPTREASSQVALGDLSCPSIKEVDRHPTVPIQCMTAADVHNWNQRVQQVVSCYQNGNANAVTFAGILDEIRVQQHNLESHIDDCASSLPLRATLFYRSIIRRAESDLDERLDETTGPFVRQRYRDRTIDDEIKRIVDRYQESLVPAQHAFTEIASEFQSFRESEHALLDALNSIARAGSNADLSELAQLKADLGEMSRDEMATTYGFAAKARLLKNWLHREEAEFSRQFDPYVDVALGWPRRAIEKPDLSSVAISSLDKMIAYAEHRVERASKAIDKLYSGLQRRTDALITIEAAQETQDALTQEATLRASADYVGEINADVEQLWSSPEKSVVLELSYRTTQVVRFNTFQQKEMLCGGEGSEPVWMEAGCQVVRRQLSAVEQNLNSTIPFALRFAVMKMTQQGVPEEALQRVTSALDEGNLYAAAVAHDVALTLSDTLPPNP